jgi:hypothetical protein
MFDFFVLGFDFERKKRKKQDCVLKTGNFYDFKNF